jgi:hypothetical protein
MIRLGNIALSVVLVLGVAEAAQAQASCSAAGVAPVSCQLTGVQVTTALQHIVALSITPNSAVLPAPTTDDFLNGATTTTENATAQALTIRSNAAWVVTLQGNPWTSPPWAKPVGDLAFTTNGGTNYTQVTTSPQNLATGSPTGSASVTLGYRIQWDIENDVPGTYTMPITLQITAQ